MKLYFSAGSCSTSCHIVMEESGLPYEAIMVDWDNPSDPNIALVSKLNPNGTLPVCITDEGKQLDQNLSIHAYIASKAPQKNLMPEAGTYEYAKALNWLSYVAADLHKTIGALFGVQAISQEKSVQDTVRKFMVGRSLECLRVLNAELAGKDYLMGKQFTPADAYAFVVLGWTQYLDIPLNDYKNIQAYMGRIAARPAVVKVLRAEGLV